MVDVPFRVDEKLNLIVTTPTGINSTDDIYEYGMSVLDQGFIKEGTIEYVDMSNVPDIHMDYESTQRVVVMYEKWLEAGWYASYYYAPSPLHRGMVNMASGLLRYLNSDELPSGLMVHGATSLPDDEVRVFLERNRYSRGV